MDDERSKTVSMEVVYEIRERIVYEVCRCESTKNKGKTVLSLGFAMPVASCDSFTRAQAVMHALAATE